MTAERFIVPVPRPGKEDIPLHVFLSGTATGPLVIFFHGAGGDHYHFDSVWPILIRAHYRVLTCDLRFHGESQTQSNQGDCTDMGAMADDVHHVLKWFKKRNGACDLIFAGLSMGGILAQVCVDQESRWRSLGYELCGWIAIACPSIHMVWPRIAWMDIYRGAPSMDPEALQIARQSIIASAVHEYGKQETARAIDLVSDATLFQCLRGCADSLTPPPHEPVPPKFDGSPTRFRHLLITGAADEYTVNVMSEWKALNGEEGIESVFRIVSDCGHMVSLDQGACLANAIIDFFSEQ
ncbi:Alpha/Beta hydrolase protein [Fennellomyces sp. T-0311]|nr:Alpha/Beta hydrolase protein [Fennellomyces sp. T-0311]